MDDCIFQLSYTNINYNIFFLALYTGLIINVTERCGYQECGKRVID